MSLVVFQLHFQLDFNELVKPSMPRLNDESSFLKSQAIKKISQFRKDFKSIFCVNPVSILYNNFVEENPVLPTVQSDFDNSAIKYHWDKKINSLTNSNTIDQNFKFGYNFILCYKINDSNFELLRFENFFKEQLTIANYQGLTQDFLFNFEGTGTIKDKNMFVIFHAYLNNNKENTLAEFKSNGRKFILLHTDDHIDTEADEDDIPRYANKIEKVFIPVDFKNSKKSSNYPIF